MHENRDAYHHVLAARAWSSAVVEPLNNQVRVEYSVWTKSESDGLHAGSCIFVLSLA
jgi:hypothetical protein